MSVARDNDPPLDPRSYGDFSMDSVCWGYREIFAEAIEGLIAEGVLSERRPEVTEKFFELMRCADRGYFDVVLKEFLGALNPRTRWILDLPSIFGDVVDVGRAFAKAKTYYGIGFFEALGEGGFGSTPAEVRAFLTHLRRLREVDDDLAFAFLKGYRRLIDRLEPSEVDQYVNEGLVVYQRNRRSGLRFMEGTLKSSEAIIQSLTRECRLGDVRNELAALLRALVGYEVDVDDLGRLDADELVERGTRVVCMYRWLYLPARVRHFSRATRNREWYLLMGVCAAGLLAENSFCRIHGHPRYATCRDLVGPKLLAANLIQVFEFARVLRRIRRRWPGARRLVDFGIRTEFQEEPPRTGADFLFLDLATTAGDERPLARRVRAELDACVNVFGTAELLDSEWVAELEDAYPGLDAYPLRALAFLPDFLFTGEVDTTPSDNLIADLKTAAEQRKRPDDPEADDDAASPDRESGHSDGFDEREAQESGVSAAYVYDEWSQPENDYYRNYCYVHELEPAGTVRAQLLDDISEEVRQVRRVFERLKPEIINREKRLADGDVINADLLLEYLVDRRREPAPKVRFYEKPLVNRRDLAALVLMDVSGSTGETVEQQKVIDVEKRAAVILGAGLASLGDRFAICGFSGNGRENCEYYTYKSMDDPWTRDTINRVLSAHPSSSTRIGAALRHSAFRLSHVEARQRLVILITDGKPMDTGYDPNTRYAQHDVRMACEESRRLDIHTFCISTEENSRADMEIMFPDRRFAILPDIRDLPRVLPGLYIRLTQ